MRKTKFRISHLRCFVQTNEAVSALEYAILVGVIAIGIGVAAATFSGHIDSALGGLGGDVAKTKITGSGNAITP